MLKWRSTSVRQARNMGSETTLEGQQARNTVSDWDSASVSSTVQASLSSAMSVKALPEKPGARKKIVIGLDYGTTNSGLSIAFSERGNVGDIEVVNQWPNGPSACKVPSTIAYPEENEHEEDDMEGVRWGFDTKGLKACLWTKLLLGGDSRQTDLDDPALRELRSQEGVFHIPAGKQAKDVVTDYLRELYAWLEAKLKRLDERLFDISPLEIWVTVPAMWTDAAKVATREAVIEAGFGSRPGDSVNIITEPEAAALAVMTQRVGLGAISGLEDGPKNVLICDCGGGTVDITTYKVSLASGPGGQLDFEELLVGVGDLCGSTFINHNFDKWMIKKFGNAYTDLEKRDRDFSSNFFSQFEDQKRGFTGPQHSRRIQIFPIQMNAEASASYKKRNGTVFLRPTDMVELFSPQIERIIKLIQDQVDAAARKNAKIDQLCLVGGFGDSPYLASRIKDWCVVREIQCGSTQACQEAIVRGAAIRGLLGMRPTRRVARRHYGYTISMPYREGLDHSCDMWVSPWDGTKWCRYRIKWFASKGQSLDDCATSTFQLQRTVFEDSLWSAGWIFVYDCDTEYAPESLRSTAVNHLGNVQTFLPASHVEQEESRMIDGKKAYLVKYEMKVELNSLRGDIQFFPSIRGNVMNSSTIEFQDTFTTAASRERTTSSSSSSAPPSTAEELMKNFPDQLV